MKTDTAIAQNLRTLRARAGLSQAAVANEIGKSQRLISKMEAGTVEPGASQLVLLAQTLHCTVEALLDGHTPAIIRRAAEIADNKETPASSPGAEPKQPPKRTRKRATKKVSSTPAAA